ncbi:MAG: hypothetical protein ACKPB0_12745, partial [Opitutaceae bacterium]
MVSSTGSSFLSSDRRVQVYRITRETLTVDAISTAFTRAVKFSPQTAGVSAQMARIKAEGRSALPTDRSERAEGN